jgi:hypothetical protein
LAPFLTASPAAAQVAHERVVRGELVIGPLPHDDLELPLALQPFEPRYAVPEYRPDKVIEPEVPIGADWEEVATSGAGAAGTSEPPPTPGPPPTAPGVYALRAVVDHWTTESEGHARVSSTPTAAAAFGALARNGQLWRRALTGAEALDLLAAAAATGGAYGRRRGAAAGRFAAWFFIAELEGLDWPPDPALIADVLRRLRFWEWDDGHNSPWCLRVVVEGADYALTIDAGDARK